MVDKVEDINIAKEMRGSFLDYAMSVIVSRALPDVRDGLKPVQRRILFTMYEQGMVAEKQYKKSARVVGNVNAQYHPHGDVAVYEAMVRMAQDFSYRYRLVDGQGNFGSVDGDEPAAMRYTEVRMTKLTAHMLANIQKNTIDFVPNYDGQQQEPVVLPARFPNLLINGATGIAVGMATNIPPHNLDEVIKGIQLLIDNPLATVEDMMMIVQGPDFPTGGLILGREGIVDAFRTGRGSVKVRAKTHTEEMGNNKQRLIVTELPYQVNKANLVEKIANLVRDKRVEGITDLRDESDRDGMRIVMELRRDVTPELLLNNLYKYTSLQISFGVNMLALVNGEPKVLNLRELIFHYLEHQIEVVKRRTKFELDKAIDRAHILEGYRIALDNIDQIISLIRGSKTTKEARDKLMQNFELSEKQAQAILDMRLQRLTGLERDKIEDEYKQLQKDIKYYRDLLADEYKLKQVVRDELEEVRIKHGDQRKTAIISAVDDIVIGDLIPRSEVAIILTHRGYIKRLPLKTYRLQHRGGKGVTGMGTKEDDFVAQLFVTDSHNNLLFFSNKGKVYRLKAYEVPELGRSAKGTPIINMLQIEKGEQIQTVLSLKEDEQSAGLLFATKYGVIKKTALQDFVNIRRGGLLAIKLRSEDELVAIHLVGAGDEVIIGTAKGQAIRFKQSDVREMGRATTGVRAISLRKDDHVIDMDIVDSAKDMLLVTTRGYGKRTKVLDYRTQTRGGKGIRSIGLTPRKGDVVAQALVARDDDLMIITKVGMVIRVKASEISLLGRYAQGVRLINLKKDSVANIALAPKSDA